MLFRSFNSLLNSSGGINKYLSGEALRVNQEQVFKATLPQFLAARQSAANSFAARGNYAAANQLENVNFSGTMQQVNDQMLQFITNQQQFERQQQDLSKLQNVDYVKATNDLVLVNGLLKEANIKVSETMPKLVESLDKLFGKDWNVNVSVDSQGGVRAFGDVLTGAVS